jgi:hypothetical protein
MIIESTYPKHIQEGLESLSTRFLLAQNEPELFVGAKITKEMQPNMAEAKEPILLPLATPEYTKYIEDAVRNNCMPYEPFIYDFSYEELEAFNWVFLMAYDIERGLGLGQIPHIKFNHSLQFILWERRLLRKVEQRYQAFEKVQINQENMILPFERSYWVIPGRLLAGEIPSSREEEVRKQKVSNLVKMGFDVVINLMEPGEKTFSGELLTDYVPDLEYYSARANKKVEVHRHSIKDLSITTPEKMKEIINLIHLLIQQGKKVYVHCWGGIGRTGTVVGCYLIEQNMATTENAIQTIEYLKRTTPIKDRRSPETDEQRDFVLDWPVLRST